MNIIKNTKKVYNFGVASEFSKVLLKRAAEKLNPNKVNGSVSNFAKQYLQTFSNWAPSMGISDDLRKYQLPLPVGVYEAVPDSAGLTRAELENKLFDEALKNAIIEINEGIIPEVKGVSTTFHFAENDAKTTQDPQKVNISNTDGVTITPSGAALLEEERKEGFVVPTPQVTPQEKVDNSSQFIDFNNPAHVAAFTGLSSAALSYLAADKKKRKSGEAWKDAAIAGIIGGGAGYIGSNIVNDRDKKPVHPTNIVVQQQKPQQPQQPQQQQQLPKANSSNTSKDFTNGSNAIPANPTTKNEITGTPPVNSNQEKQLTLAEIYNNRTKEYSNLFEQIRAFHDDYNKLRTAAGYPAIATPVIDEAKDSSRSRQDYAEEMAHYLNTIRKSLGLPATGVPENEDPYEYDRLLEQYNYLKDYAYKNASDLRMKY